MYVCVRGLELKAAVLWLLGIEIRTFWKAPSSTIINGFPLYMTDYEAASEAADSSK